MKNGLLICFFEIDVWEMGRIVVGVKGIILIDDDVVVGMEILEEELYVFIVIEKGYGKWILVEEYRI